MTAAAASSTTTSKTSAKPDITVPVGQLVAVKPNVAELKIPNIASSLVIVVYDKVERISTIAHVILPDSKLAPNDNPEERNLPARFTDLAIPLLVEEFEKIGGQKVYATARLIGGAQLFNFGGGGGNPLNVGSRNAITARSLLTKTGVGVEKADIGGNKARQLRFTPGTGEIFISLIGGREYIL
jgi:chemotaxis protein CheD